MSNNPYAAYRSVEATTADPITLTTMLYEGAIKALRKSRLHWESGNRQGFNDESNRAYLIIGELLATLDMSQGEISEGLAGLYAYCMRLITESSLGDLAKLQEVEQHIAKICEAWKTATAGLRAQGQATSLRAGAAA